MPNAINGWLTLMAGGGCIYAARWGLRAEYHISFAPKRWLLWVGWLEESLNALGINRPCRNVICFPPLEKKKKAESSSMCYSCSGL